MVQSSSHQDTIDIETLVNLKGRHSTQYVSNLIIVKRRQGISRRQNFLLANKYFQAIIFVIYSTCQYLWEVNNYRRRYLSVSIESNIWYIRYILKLQTVIYVSNYNYSGCVLKFPLMNYKIVLASRDQIHSHESFY